MRSTGQRADFEAIRSTVQGAVVTCKEMTSLCYSYNAIYSDNVHEEVKTIFYITLVIMRVPEYGLGQLAESYLTILPKLKDNFD